MHKALLILFFLMPCIANAKVYTLGTTELELEEVRTEEERNKGLMHRKELPPHHGMIFIYDKPQQLVFWMKNTHIPLDIIFIDKNGVITQIHKNAKPMSLKPIRSNIPSLYVIEINSGESDKLGIKVGDKLNLHKS